MDMTSRSIALALASPEDEALWRTLLESQGMATLPLDATLRHCRALVADVAVLARRGLSPAEAARWIRSSHPDVRLIVRLPQRAGFTPSERAWARAAGIDSLLPGGTVAAWQESIRPMVERILAAAGQPALDDTALERAVRDLLKRGMEPRPCAAKDIYADAFALRSQGIDAMALCEAMQQPGAVASTDRQWHGKRYRDCFVASEALDWLESRQGLRRASAGIVCRFLWRTARIHHVVRDAAFADEHLFFRFAGTRAHWARTDLTRLDTEMHGANGLDVRDRAWRGRTFPRCFVGEEAVEWIMRAAGLSFGAAESAGQSLLELGVLAHVTGEHGFIGDHYFYRLAAHERALAPAQA
jgi:hypothetical protein